MSSVTLEKPLTLLAQAAEGLKAGTVVPYIGPGISALDDAAVPLSPEALAAFLATKTTLPRRAVGNAWAAAQYIESHRFRATLVAWMREAFATPVTPSPFHRWLAGLGVPLIVDSWYTAEMRIALQDAATDWIEVQGISRAHIGEDHWFKFYDPAGEPSNAQAAGTARTLLYTPHGNVLPSGNFLISDADYVEVLTEIDIQTPIPEEVRQRRTGKSFLFIGCHFHDQMLRSYAKQISKRSSDQHYAIVDAASLTRNEARFLEDYAIAVIDLNLGEALARLST